MTPLCQYVSKSFVSPACRSALAQGYRQIDCASFYGNETTIGERMMLWLSASMCNQIEWLLELLSQKQKLRQLTSLGVSQLA